jgi:hypothetical protein
MIQIFHKPKRTKGTSFLKLLPIRVSPHRFHNPKRNQPLWSSTHKIGDKIEVRKHQIMHSPLPENTNYVTNHENDKNYRKRENICWLPMLQ